MHYTVAGEGEPVVLVHGLSASSLWWTRNVRSLAEHYRVYMVDLPGFGTMRRAHRRFALIEAADWLLAWMEAVGIERAHLVGHSMGGYICIQLAVQRPDSVRRLVLIAPAGLPGGRTIRGYLVPLLLAIWYTTPTFLVILFYDALRTGPLMLLRAAQDLLSKDMREDLKAIKAPTLIIWGVNDTLVSPQLGRVLRQEIANARLLVLPGAGHIVMFDRAREVNRALLEFLAGKAVAE
ncbi:MAG: alpha/beta fold hydrolase [Ktedonobacteraceae bacterium]|nr:alpha/beta fold hydrolase [Ktedonobacteraceae bacterium]